MRPLNRIEWPVLSGTIGLVLAALFASVVGVFLLEERAGISDASMLFLLAVALVAYLRGSLAAVLTSVGAFLTYNFLFVPPRFTFQVADPQHLLTLLLLLAVGLAIGRLTGLQRDQARRSDGREREARALFAISRSIASAKRTAEALPLVVTDLAADARLDRVWIGLGPTRAQEQVVADTNPEAHAPGSSFGSFNLLRRPPHERNSVWIRLSPPGPPVSPHRDGLALYRIELADGDEVIGSLWASREPRLGPPSPEETRLLAAAADQIGQAIIRDRLHDQATEVEVARRSEELKTALLDSVSHDLRTPLATIRATAGSLADSTLDLAPEDRRAMAGEIDAEADRLARLVGGLLDMTRIEGGALRASPEPIPVGDVVLPAVHRARGGLSPRPIQVVIADDLPAVAVDEILANQVLDNLLENVIRHTPPDALVRISAQRMDDSVRLRIEDGGPGVPAEAMGHLFEKFYRVPARRGVARVGTGLGLAVVKGMADVMGGSVAASRSELGGLAIDVHLPVASEPAE